ncbi:MAG: hypothetical protein U0R65_07810 [Candidatus Nanopelagicales bacterium]
MSPWRSCTEQTSPRPRLDLIGWWLATQDWFTEDGPVEREAAFRLDDPAGEVGIETFIVRSGAFVPRPGDLSVRAARRWAPRRQARSMVLGHRWVYSGPSDPVYVATTSAAIANGGHEVDMFFEDGTQQPRPDWYASATGSGAGSGEVVGALAVARSVPAPVPPGVATLDVTWGGLASPMTVAWLS